MTKLISQHITQDFTVGVIMTWAFFVGAWFVGIALLLLSLTL